MLLNRKCKNCLIPERYPNFKLNEKRIGNYCTTTKKIDKTEEKKLLKKEFEGYLNKIKGKNQYDCVLLYSGGKDSTYLLYILTKKYGLKVLTVTVDNGLGTNIQKENIKKCVEFFDVDNITITPKNEFYRRLYRHIFQNKGEDSFSRNICFKCFGTIQCIGLNIAAKKKIPLVLSANSPDQINSSQYSIEKNLKKWDPFNILENPNFFKEDLEYFWDPKKYDITPRFVRPFYFLDYPGVEKIIKELVTLGFGQKKKFSPLSTNCSMSWLLIFLDLKKYGENIYVENYHRLIRYKKVNRLKWRIMLPIAIFLLRNRLVKRKQINQALKYVDLRLKDLL